MSPWIVFLLAWSSFVTWETKWMPALEHARVEIGDWHDPPPAIYVDGVIYLAPAATKDLDDLEWGLLHEVQHYLASKDRPRSAKEWEQFEEKAIAALMRGAYSREQIFEFKYACSYGPWEGHAQLPWIVKGRIPKALRSWYPWFQFESQMVKEKR